MVKKSKPSQGIAIAGLLVNVLVIPGLGSIIGGRTNEGIIQLILFLVGIPLSFVLIGIPIVFASWVWALVTGIQLVKDAE